MVPAPIHKRWGFTLLEVLVALAVLAIALSAGMKAVAQGAALAESLRDRNLALWVARELWDAGRESGRGDASGTLEWGGLQWSWRRRTEEAALPGLRREIVDVACRQDPRAAVSLSGFVLAPQ